jgi:hypothetical protein
MRSLLQRMRRVVLEFLVIALGVSAGLAADNWNDGRKERELERAFLQGVASDLSDNIREVELITANARSLETSLLRVIAAVRTGRTQWSTAEQMVEDLVKCTYLGIPRLSSVTWDEIRTTGSLRLLRDREFKRRLGSYYQRYDYNAQFHPEYRRKEAAVEEALLGLLPFDARIEMAAADKIASAGVSIEEWLPKLRNAPRLVDRLEDMAWVQRRIVVRYDWVVRESREMIASVEAAR